MGKYSKDYLLSITEQTQEAIKNTSHRLNQFLDEDQQAVAVFSAIPAALWLVRNMMTSDLHQENTRNEGDPLLPVTVYELEHIHKKVTEIFKDVVPFGELRTAYANILVHYTQTFFEISIDLPITLPSTLVTKLSERLKIIRNLY